MELYTAAVQVSTTYKCFYGSPAYRIVYNSVYNRDKQDEPGVREYCLSQEHELITVRN